MKELNMQKIFNDQINVPASLLKNYKKLHITETEAMLLLHLYRIHLEGDLFPTPDKLQSFLTISKEDCSKILRKLIQMSLLSIEEDKEKDKVEEYYSFEPLWRKLYLEKEESKKEEVDHFGEIFLRYEQEFGRPLSPFEIEMINLWIDEEEIPKELIYAALREAVLMAKINMKYIDRILRDWKQKGIKSVHDARLQGKNFHSQTNNNESKEEDINAKELYYNWLEE